jgi:hypothetical protein
VDRSPDAPGLPAKQTELSSEGIDILGEVPFGHRSRITICDEMARHCRTSVAFGGDGEDDGFGHVERYGAQDRNRW